MVIPGPNSDDSVKFRENLAMLVVDMKRMATGVYGDFVARCSHPWWVGYPDRPPLAVYGMNKLAGVNYVTACPSSIGLGHQRSS
jgi:hypothetical protein